MNISIITPGGCSAKCDFCFWEIKKTPKNYISKLYNFLSTIESGRFSLSITGAEPTESVYLYHILKMISSMKNKFTKVVMTTNGSRLMDFINIEENLNVLQKAVDHINISRHHYNENVNERIFNSKNIPTNDEVMQIITFLNMVGIDVTFNCVLTDMMNDKENVINYIVHAKNMHASAVTFRDAHDGDSITINPVEKIFSSYKTIQESSCGACRIATKIIAGIKCNFHYSVKEPTKVMDGIYEFIIQQNGDVTLDWDGNLIYTGDDHKEKVFDHKYADKLKKLFLGKGTSYNYNTYSEPEPCSWGCESPSSRKMHKYSCGRSGCETTRVRRYTQSCGGSGCG